MTTLADPAVEADEIGRTRPLNASVLLGIVVIASILLPSNPLAQGTVIAGLVLLLGALCTTRLGLDRQELAVRVVVTLALGLLVVFLVGALVGSILPHLGLARPLGGATVKVLWVVIVGAITCTVGIQHSDPVRETLLGVVWRHAAWGLALCIPPVISLIGVARLNAGGSGDIALVVGILVIVMVALAVALPSSRHAPPRVLLLFSALVTSAWQGTMRGGLLFGGDLQHEYYVGQLAISQGVFPLRHYTDPYAGMLPLTVWPAQIHGLTGLSLRVFLALVPAVILGLCLVVIWCTVREWVEPQTAAAICALLLLGSYSMLREMPGVSRECYALLFFTLLIFSITSRRFDMRTARTLAAICGLGMALSHYSSAYIAAACVLGAWVLSLIVRQDPDSKVINFPVVASVAGSAVIWGAFVARTGSNFSQTLSSISHQGFRLLPGSGSLFSRWISGANISKLVSAQVIRASDLSLLRGAYHWMQVDPAARTVPIRNVTEPRSHGVAVLGPFVSTGGVIISEVVLVAAVVSIGICLWRCRTDRRLAQLCGLALTGAVIAAISRSSETLAEQFGPTRVQLQMYLVFAVTIAVSVSPLPTRAWSARRWWAPLAAVAGIVAAVSVVNSSVLSSVVEKNAQLVSYFSIRGDQVTRLSTPQDLVAGQWLANHDPTNKLIQTDWDGQYVMYAFGYANRRGFIPSIDPITTDVHAWLLANHTNIVGGVSRGGNGSETGVFNFPQGYLGATRAVLYVSGTDVVYGSDRLALARKHLKKAHVALAPRR